MIKIVLVVMISAILITYLKSINPELSTLAIIATSVLLLLMLLEYLSDGFSLIADLVKLTNINNDLYKIIIKMTVLGYIIEFSAGVVTDLGLKSLADKLIFAGKMIILSLSLPIIYALLNVIIGLIT
jgi:stage III sporulation protein AD